MAHESSTAATNCAGASSPSMRWPVAATGNRSPNGTPVAAATGGGPALEIIEQESAIIPRRLLEQPFDLPRARRRLPDTRSAPGPSLGYLSCFGRREPGNVANPRIPNEAIQRGASWPLWIATSIQR
jgi:hypothetical protein